ncbi:MAG: valine--tRNA ligase, partial [Ardenticatenales bacterium]|nr:valine--tRNA ligase [Ardenticatenales bacterium]
MLPRKYNPNSREPEWRDQWQRQGTYQYQPDSDAPLFAIDTPPPTVSGQLHLGHVYSYSQTDFLARYRRMQGDNVYYPMGFDDNGLPTERLVERQEGIRPEDVGRQKFIEICLATSEKAEAEYQALWQRLGLSIDWRYTYRTIDEDARRLAQASFLDLLARGLAYRQQAPALWCPTCQTAIAQADVADLNRLSEYVTIPFTLADGGLLPIATTRPELLPACVAVFVHPEDERFAHLVGQMARTPLSDRPVPILADIAADPAKGSGAVMCCTFGDSTDLAWWRTHELPLIEAIGRDGRMTAAAGDLAGLTVPEARGRIKERLAAAGLLLQREPTEQTVTTHDRCDTPIEFIQTAQWFINVLDHKERLLAAADELEWRPAHMKARYQQWVSNLNWDWCISRQRYFGVPFPVWYCDGCGAIQTVDPAQLPLDPTATQPATPCTQCGGTTFTGDGDVMDTWATSSLTPQIAANLRLPGVAVDAPADYLPYGLRPQAHEIIRTWTFYTVLKSLYHFDRLPWRTVALSGWGLAPEGEGKISKSRTSGVVGPLAMIERYSADAVRYWAASTSLGKDSRISEEKIQAGARLVTKLWNVARFAQRFLPL